MLDMLIQGGRVVTPAGVGDWDVGVVGEKDERRVLLRTIVYPGQEPLRAISGRGSLSQLVATFVVPARR